MLHVQPTLPAQQVLPAWLLQRAPRALHARTGRTRVHAAACAAIAVPRHERVPAGQGWSRMGVRPWGEPEVGRRHRDRGVGERRSRRWSRRRSIATRRRAAAATRGAGAGCRRASRDCSRRGPLPCPRSRASGHRATPPSTAHGGGDGLLRRTTLRCRPRTRAGEPRRFCVARAGIVGGVAGAADERAALDVLLRRSRGMEVDDQGRGLLRARHRWSIQCGGKQASRAAPDDMAFSTWGSNPWPVGRSPTIETPHPDMDGRRMAAYSQRHDQ